MATSLPPIQDVERLTPYMIRILGGNPSKFSLQGTNTYLLGTGPSRLLIDTGQGEQAWLESLKSTVTSESASIDNCLLTHWHPDHIGGCPDLISIFPNVAIHKSQQSYYGDGRHELSTQVHKLLREKGAQKSGFLGDIFEGSTYPIPGCPELSLTALYTPGHTTDHMCFLLKEIVGTSDKIIAIFTGDNILGHGTAVFEDLKTYMESLQRMGDTLGQGNAILYPAHGEMVVDGRAKVKEYIEHRQQREQQVLQVLASDKTRPWTSMEIVKVVYKDVPESLHVAAEGGTRQVLEKLEKEGKVEKQGDKWILNNLDKSRA